MPGPVQRLAHHDLCFGCGMVNPFGLLLEMQPAAEGAVVGRFFVKQDHQGPPGHAHPGVISAALHEAMALAVHAEGTHAVTSWLTCEFHASAPIGTFVHVQARIEAQQGRRISLHALARGEGEEALATARAALMRRAPGIDAREAPSR